MPASKIGLYELHDSCTRNGQCKSNFCYERTCTRPWELGQFCQPILRNCPTGLHCDWRSQTCVPQFYAPPGNGTCRQQSDCLPEEFCNGYEKCEKRGVWAQACQVNEQCDDGYGCYGGLCLQKCVLGRLRPKFDCPPGFTCGVEQLCLPDRYFLKAQSEEEHDTVLDRMFPFCVLGVIGVFMLAFVALSFSQCWEESRRRQMAREKRAAAKVALEPIRKLIQAGLSANMAITNHLDEMSTMASADPSLIMEEGHQQHETPSSS